MPGYHDEPEEGDARLRWCWLVCAGDLARCDRGRRLPRRCRAVEGTSLSRDGPRTSRRPIEEVVNTFTPFLISAVVGVPAREHLGEVRARVVGSRGRASACGNSEAVLQHCKARLSALQDSARRISDCRNSRAPDQVEVRSLSGRRNMKARREGSVMDTVEVLWARGCARRARRLSGEERAPRRLASMVATGSK